MKRFLSRVWPQLFAIGAITLCVYALGLIATPLGLAAPIMGMAISFPTIPTTIRVPAFFAEFDSSRANQGSALLEYRALVVGQKTSAGTWAANSINLATNANQVATGGGRGSLLHRQAIRWFEANKSTPTYFGVLADNGAGVAASGNVLFAGTATAAGTVSFWAGGAPVSVAVASGDTAATVATAFAAAFPSTSDLPVTGAVDGSVTQQVNLTYRHKGTAGNEFDLRVNYQLGEALPAGITTTITQMTSGATNPVLTTLISNMGDTWFQILTMPYTDATSLTAMETELASRFGAMRMIDGYCFVSKDDTLANLATLGNTRNSPHISIVCQAGDNPVMPSCEFAAQTAAVAAYYGSIDPARPFQTLALPTMLAPAETDQYTLVERNLLLFDGISTTKVAGGGVVQLERLISTYKTNANGADDTAYLNTNTMLTLMYLRYSFRARILTKYPRHKLANDGTRIAPGQAIITPKIGKAEAVLWFRDMESKGLVENFDDFKTNLLCVRNEDNQDRLDWLLPPDLVNQFIVGAANVQFRL